ncbi:pyridoxal phosphate-dependent transferase [Aspergillus aurantiobrunneus]
MSESGQPDLRLGVGLCGKAFAGNRPAFFDILSDLWDPESNVNGIVNIGLAENNNAKAHTLTYGDSFTGSKALRRPYSGVSNAVECCALSLFEPGDYVLVGRPCWTTFRHLFGTRAGVNVLEVSFRYVDPFSHEAVRLYEKGLQHGRRCYRRDELESYMELCNACQLHLISDEIYGLSVWNDLNLGDSAPFTSALTVNAAQIIDPSMVHVVWGLSKDFGATGLRIGCLISQGNPAFLKSVEGISSLLRNDGLVDRFVSLARSRLAESYHHSNSALFIWANLAAVVKDGPLPDEEILLRLLKKRVYHFWFDLCE